MEKRNKKEIKRDKSRKSKCRLNQPKRKRNQIQERERKGFMKWKRKTRKLRKRYKIWLRENKRLRK